MFLESAITACICHLKYVVVMSVKKQSWKNPTSVKSTTPSYDVHTKINIFKGILICVLAVWFGVFGLT